VSVTTKSGFYDLNKKSTYSTVLKKNQQEVDEDKLYITCKKVLAPGAFFINIYFGVPHLATFISFFIEYVIASIAYIHPVYSGIRTHDLLDVSLLP
jgi:hypothetical protein